jgi:hypothetical protein
MGFGGHVHARRGRGHLELRQGCRGGIGDTAAREAWTEMVKVALKETEGAKPNIEAEVDRLSRLTWLDYERGRCSEAKKLRIRASALDMAVRKRREMNRIQEYRAKMAAKYP